jgi:hypothetical protein
MLERLKDERRTPHLSRFQNALSNDIEFSGERKRVRCNEWLGRRLATVGCAAVGGATSERTGDRDRRAGST